MGLFSRFSSATRTAVGNLAVRALSNSVAKGYMLPGNGGAGYGGWLGAVGGHNVPHEPFAGAWQRNMDNAAGAGPLLLSNSAIYTCTDVISSSIASLPVRILQPSDSPDVRVPHVNHPYWGLLQKPNSFQTSLQFLQQYMLSKLTTGNVYVFMVRDARSVVNEMFVLDPSCVQVLLSDTGEVFYRLNRDLLAGVDTGVTVPARDIIHDRMMCIGGAGQGSALVGTSPLYAAALPAMMAGRMQMASETFFANMSRASGVLVAPGKIEPTVARKLQAEWEANYSARGLGKTAVLTNGLEFKPMSVDAADSELVAQLGWTIRNIASIYHVPQYMLGEMDKATYRNSEQMSRDYYRQCLGYHINAFEQCFNAGLQLSGGVVVEFDLTELFRMELDARYGAYQIGLQAGFLAINEVRALEDLPPVPGGDQPRVQMQYVPLAVADQLALANAKPPAPSPAPAPPAPAPAPKTIGFDGITDIVSSNDQLELNFEFEPEQLDLLVAAFGERFTLSETTQNGA